MNGFLDGDITFVTNDEKFALLVRQGSFASCINRYRQIKSDIPDHNSYELKRFSLFKNKDDAICKAEKIINKYNKLKGEK